VSVEALAVPGVATIATGAFAPRLEQTEGGESAGPIQRSYWIGQTFTPTQPRISAVEIGIKVNTAPTSVRAELREVDGEGLPDMSSPALLATGVASLETTGDLLIPLIFNGLALDGQQYAIVFLRESGEFEVQLHQTGSSPNGNLVRAYSLDWIHIPAFDCKFRTFDQDGLVDQAQLTSNADAFDHETGVFLAQTFTVSAEIIGAVEVMVTDVTAGDVLAAQLRRTGLDGRPDLSQSGLLESTTSAVQASGPLRFEVDWPIEPDLRGQPLALLFLSRQVGLSSVHLARSAGDSLASGEAIHLLDTLATPLGGDLWLRLEERSHASQGTLTFRHSAGQTAEWREVTIDADLPQGTSVETRVAFASDEVDLAAAPWSAWMVGTDVELPAHPISSWIALQMRLTTSDGRATPTLHGVRVSWFDVLLLDSMQGFLIR
jgi:hypothetical protein